MPGSCLMCELATDRKRDLCIHCEKALPWIKRGCSTCGIPLENSVRNPPTIFSETDTNLFSGTGFKNHDLAAQTPKFAQCTSCRIKPLFPTIARTLTPLSYSECARWLVQQQKHSKGIAHGRVLAELLGDAVVRQYSHAAELPELLIPVPLHWRRLITRGHNQSVNMAATIGERIQRPVANQLVTRTRATAPQQTLDAKHRSANVASAFSSTKSAQRVIATLAQKRVAIVDDVVTTGATAQALATTLIAAGVKEVHLWSPTRAILKPDD